MSKPKYMLAYELYKEGLPVGDIAERLGVKQSTVRHYIGLVAHPERHESIKRAMRRYYQKHRHKLYEYEREYRRRPEVAKIRKERWMKWVEKQIAKYGSYKKPYIDAFEREGDSLTKEEIFEKCGFTPHFWKIVRQYIKSGIIAKKGGRYILLHKKKPKVWRFLRLESDTYNRLIALRDAHKLRSLDAVINLLLEKER